jgi:hypothetical protein
MLLLLLLAASPLRAGGTRLELVLYALSSYFMGFGLRWAFAFGLRWVVACAWCRTGLSQHTTLYFSRRLTFIYGTVPLSRFEKLTPRLAARGCWRRGLLARRSLPDSSRCSVPLLARGDGPRPGGGRPIWPPPPPPPPVVARGDDGAGAARRGCGCARPRVAGRTTLTRKAVARAAARAAVGGVAARSRGV